MMIQSYTPTLIEALRTTLENVEQAPDVQADDPSLAQLREILGRRVARLQLEMASEFFTAASEACSHELDEDEDCEMAS